MPAWRITRARLLRLIRTDRHAMSVGMGATGLLSLLLTLALLPKPFGMAHVLAAVGMLQVVGCLYLALSVSAARLRNQSRTPAPVNRTATAELIAARDEALAADRAKSRFLASMSHEIRTPMTGILGMTGLLQGTQMTAEQKTYAKAVDRSARTLLALIDEILDFSKIEAGRLTLHVAPFGLEECIESAVELLAPRAHEKGLELAWLIEPGVPLAVAGDEARVRQILLNLIGNAVKFTDTGGVLIRISSNGLGGSPATRDRRLAISIAVEDTGSGIGEHDLPRLFSEFAQAERTLANRHGGTGLGLAISRRLAQAMGGDIAVESTLGKGSTFRVDLTLLEQPGAEISGEAGSSDTVSQRRVLLALDRDIERQAAASILASNGMHVEAVGFAAALTRLEQAAHSGRCFDVVVIDAMAGLEPAGHVLHRARALAGARKVDGMVVIDAATRPILQEFRNLGFAGWSVRPLRPRSFARLIARGISDDNEARPCQPIPPAEPLVRPSGRPIRVLLAEDDDINALLGSCVLQKAGCLPTLVRSGRQAVDEVKRGIDGGEPDFDIILMDIIMPELGGIEAARAIQKHYAARAQGPRIAPPIVALTANAFAEDRERYLASGLDDYLAKPFDGSDLQALLLRWSPRLRANLAA